jgi:hypothetical protein
MSQPIDLTVPDPAKDPNSALRTLILQPPPKEPKANRWHWTTGDTLRELATLGLIGMDWHQTRDFRADGVEELNPVLGARPSRARVNTLIGAAMLGHPIVARLLPKPWRDVFQYGTIGAETVAVLHNRKDGYEPLHL